MGELQLATANLQDQYGNWENKIISLSSLSRSIGDDKSYEVSGISIELSDKARFFRDMMSGENRYIVGKPVEIYTQDHQWLYTGTVDKWQFKEDTFVLVINDKLSGLDVQLTRIITPDLFPNLTPNANGQSVPIIYGQIQCDSGAVKCWKVDDKKYLLAGHHCKELTAVFIEDGTDVSSDFELSGEGVTEQGNDFAFAVYKGTSIEDPFVLANVVGKKSGADSFIENPADALTDLIGSYTTMTCDTGMMDNIRKIMAARLYKISLVIDRPLTLEQVLMIFCTGFDCDYFIRQGNQVALAMLEWTFLKPRGYFNKAQVVDFQIEELSEDIRNKVYYKYVYSPADKQYLQTRVYSKQDSIDKWGEFFASNEPLELMVVADDITALDVVQRYLIQRKNPRRIAQLELPLQEFSGLDIADIIEISHPNAIDENKRKYQLRRVNIDFTGDGVQVEAVDITYMTGGIFILGDRLTLSTFWNDAVGTQRDYGYLCDSVSEKFGNGIDIGKGLY